MKEYFKCKRCYSEIGMHKIARHHLKVHPDVPMEQYVDYFFDLNRPLLKCEFCRCKLSEKQLTKHLQRAHLTKYREQQRKLLISTKHILGTKLPTTFVDLSDSEEEGPTKEPTVDKNIQCNIIGNHTKPKELVDKCIETENVNGRGVDVETQTDEQNEKYDTCERMELSVEYDEEDGWVGLVLC